MLWSRAEHHWRGCLVVCLIQPDRNPYQKHYHNGVHRFMLFWINAETKFMLFSFSVFCVIQSRVACTPPRRKPLESDFETIKLISNGAYGWVRQTSLLAFSWLSLFVDATESPIKAEKKLKWGCVVCVFVFTQRICLDDFSFTSELMFSQCSSFFSPTFFFLQNLSIDLPSYLSIHYKPSYFPFVL